MSRREGQLFVGRLSKSTRVRDVEDVFEPYGRMTRCDVKYGAEMAYAFIDYEDRRDAEDAIKYENGREIAGSAIIVEMAKGNPRRPQISKGYDECYRCHRAGHWARDCPDDRYSGGFRRSSRGSGRYRSPSPRRRRRSRSRSRSRSRDRRRRRSRSRSRSRSRDRGRRSRSRSGDRKKSSWKRSRSKSKSKSPSRSKSKSRSVTSKSRSRSRSGSPGPINGANDSRSHSRSRSRSKSPSE